MAANKTQLIAILAENSGLTLAQAEAFLNALPESYGEWMRNHGAEPGPTYIGDDGNFTLSMSRVPPPGAAWVLKLEPRASFLADYGNGDERFGLPVTND